MTQITCTIHGHSVVEPKFLDCPWCLESTITRQSSKIAAKDKALKLAIDVLGSRKGLFKHNEGCRAVYGHNNLCTCGFDAALTACREALGDPT